MVDGTSSQFGFSFVKKPNFDIYLTPTDAEHKYTLIWMHGLGDSSEGFLDFFYTRKSVVPNKNTKVILLNAPKQPITINGGASMNSWYDIYALGSEPRADEVQIAKSTKRVLGVVSEEAKALGDDYKKIFIGGFSQGCFMSLNVALQAPHLLGGVVGLSGGVFPSL